MKKQHWLLPGLLGVLLLGSPAEAANLQFWRFDTSQNRLTFTTDEGVQPRAQLIPDPTRVVIDLPGVTLDRPKISQNLGSIIRAMRIGQFEPGTTRIVIELAPGYTLDPQQIRVRGASPTDWSVELPNPQRLAAEPVQPPLNPPTSTLPGNSESASGQPNSTTPASSARSTNQIEDLRVTPSGIFVATSGKVAAVKVERSRNKKQIAFQFPGTTVASRLAKNKLTVDRYGIRSVRAEQVSKSPATVRLTLNVDKTSPDWRALVSNSTGVMLLPASGSPSVSDEGDRVQQTTSLLTGRPGLSTAPASNLAQSVATIEGVDLGGSQLLIRANRPISYTTGWDGSAYRITIRSAQLSPNIKGPRLGPGSPLSQVRLRQEDASTVTILATPASGVRVQGIQQLNSPALIVQLLRSDTSISVTPPPTTSIITPPPAVVSQPPLPRVVGRKIVVIDPGHGGPDVGAVGIGGLRETNVVLPIGLEVSRILQRQGLQVYLTRTDERDVDLPPRVALAERVNADVFVSIHANSISLSRQDISGLETYHAPGAIRGARLAQIIHNSILQTVNIRDRGVRSARFYVVRRTSMPSVLVEVGFVTGREDAANLSNPNFRNQMAAAIARGVIQFLQGGG